MKNEIIEDRYPPGMTADGSGVVEEILVQEGQIIKKGDVLANIVSGDYELEYDSHHDGVLIELLVEEGQTVMPNQFLWRIKLDD